MSRFVLRQCALLAKRGNLQKDAAVALSPSAIFSDPLIGRSAASGIANGIYKSALAATCTAPSHREFSSSAGQIGSASAQVGFLI